jgi:ketosteroid isomerase-like protein
MTNADVSALIRHCYSAYERKDRQAIEALLADDFTFTSPLDDHIDRAAYFERCWPNSRTIRAFTIEQLFVQGTEAFARYRVELDDGKEFRNVEFFRVEGSKIAEVDVYFGRTLVEASKA